MASVSGVGGSAGGSGGSDGSGGTGTAAIRGISKTSRGKKKVAKRVVNDPSLMPMPSIGTSGGAIPLYPEVPVEPYTLDEIMDPGCVDCYNRIVIIPEGDGYLPFKSSAKAIAEVIQEKYKKPWLSWGEIKEDKTPQIREVDQFLHCFKQIKLHPKATWESAIEKLVTNTSSFIKESKAIQKSHSASIKNLETQLGQLAHQLAQRAPENFPCDTVPNPRNNVNVVTTRSGKVSEPVLPKTRKGVRASAPTHSEVMATS
ncbi:uncharacterized protein [Cicer arietinum]|uniref:uncharacterized protein n=1 Tax=Cicer arietinum TaxID=3827 RepID=UPI003CC66A9A